MCLNFAFIPLVYFFFPETSNVSLEDVDRFFIEDGDPVKVARRIQKEMKQYGGRTTSFESNEKSGVSHFDKVSSTEKGAAHVDAVWGEAVLMKSWSVYLYTNANFEAYVAVDVLMGSIMTQRRGSQS